MSEQDAQQENMGAKKQRLGKQCLGEGVGFPVGYLAFTMYMMLWQTNASFSPRYVFVKARVNLIKMLCGPNSGSRASKTRRSENRSRSTDVGRAPAGAISNRKSTARIRSSPSLNDFCVVLSVVSICCSRFSTVRQRLALL